MDGTINGTSTATGVLTSAGALAGQAAGSSSARLTIVWVESDGKILQKHPDEVRTYRLNFKAYPEIVGGETIGTVTVTKELVTGADSLTISDELAAGASAQFVMAGGDDGDEYVIKAVVTTSAQAILAGCARLKVTGCPL